MAWEQLSIDRPHLAYIILGGFTSLFMLCSLFIKEKLYIGEATVATLVGVIFGPHAANLFNPLSWGNTDQITIECSRIVLVVQCFAVGVELPKSYMEKHWKSVVFLLLPVMTWGWLATSLFIWWMVEPLSWLDSLACAACVTATDPVLASSVVGKGKFAKRVPKHLRDVLSAESGCNDGMAFPFIYLSLYLIRYRPDAGKVTFHWLCFTVLYECIFGAVYGFLVGYIARHAIKQAEKRGLIDRESFLVFYFVLALFCAGSGSLLGMDDLLIGFAAGVGFSNDGWFTEKTEESHVSNVIDLLLNLAYFVYFGSIIPWEQFNAPDIGLVPWRLVVISLFVIFFRRIPIMLALKPIIPDVKTWREALFAGHFGPIGVGAIFAAILARAELENETAIPDESLPGNENPHHVLIKLIWPITTFLVISSILVHGSSIAVFTLGKRINTLSITLSYTQDNENRTWMDRLPRIQSQSKSMARSDASGDSFDKPEFPPNTLPPIGLPRNFLRRQREEETSRPGSRSSSLRPIRRRKAKDTGDRLGGRVEESAIRPIRRSEPMLVTQESGSDTLNEKSDEQSPDRRQQRADFEVGPDAEPPSPMAQGRDEEEDADVEAYQEGDELIIEDEEGNVLRQEDVSGLSAEERAQIIEETRQELARETSGEHTKHKHEPHEKNEGEEIQQDVEDAVEGAVAHPESTARRPFVGWRGFSKAKKTEEESGEAEESSRRRKEKPAHERKRGPAHAYQFGNTIIVEDEDGEVIKKYTIPAPDKRPGEVNWLQKTSKAIGGDEMKRGISRVGAWVGLGGNVAESSSSGAVTAPTSSSTKPTEQQENGDNEKAPLDPESDDDGLRYVVSQAERYGPFGTRKDKSGEVPTIFHSGRRMSKQDFIKQIQSLDPKSRAEAVDESSASEAVKRDVRKQANVPGNDYFNYKESTSTGRARSGTVPSSSSKPQVRRYESSAESPQSPPRPDVRRAATDAPARPKPIRTATAESMDTINSVESAEVPMHDVAASLARLGQGHATALRRERLANMPEDAPEEEEEEEIETAAEKRRRLAALGTSRDQETSSDEDEDVPRTKGRIQFASPPASEVVPASSAAPATAAESEPNTDSRSPVGPPKMRISWGGERGREEREREGRKKKR